MRAKLYLLSQLCLLYSAGSMAAQSTTDQALDQGVKAYQAYHMSNIDSVNLQNGNLTVMIPILSYPQRGSQGTSYSLRYNAKQLKPQSNCSPDGESCTDLLLMQPEPYNGIGLQLIWDQQIYITTNYIKEPSITCIPTESTGPCGTFLKVMKIVPSKALRDATGAAHPLALVSTGLWRTADGSGYQVRSIDNQGDTEIVFPNGTVETTDANGNTMNAQDTMGRPYFSPPPETASSTTNLGACPSTLPLPTTSAMTFSVPGVSNGSATYTECYATLNVVTSYNLTDSTQSSGDLSVLQGFILPDGTSWVFSYESGTANLTNITTPLGGSIQYQWGAGSGSPCSAIANLNPGVSAKTVDANDGTGPHTWNYAWTIPSNSNYWDWWVKVTDPLNNDTVTQFQMFGVAPGCSYYPHVVTSYQGAQSDNQVLKTVTTEYTPASPSPAYMGTIGVYPTSVTTVQNNVTSKIEMDNDQGFTATTEDPIWAGNTYTVPYGKVLAKREYDFGTTQPGSLLRTTNTQYMAFANSTYMNANFMNLVSSRTILDGAGVQQAQVQYGYDESALSSSGITTNVISSPWGSLRGNLTSTRAWLNGATLATTPSCTPQIQSGYLVTTKTYFDTGEVSQTTNACGQSTSYGYDSAYVGAYQTSVTDALGTTQKTYDFNTGLPTSDIDLNSQTTSYAYVDPLARITKITTPDVFQGTSGGSTFTYNYNSNPSSVLVTEQLSNSATKQVVATVDGLGKLLTTELTTDPDTPTYVTHGYDALGRENATSNPMHCSSNSSPCSESTAGTTQHIFDGLGRETQTIPQDGTPSTNYVSTSYYPGNAVLVSDQVGVSSQRNYDALGRLTQVDEVNSRWATNYYYDILGNLTCVEQQGGVSGSGCAGSPSQDATSPWRVRRFTYDALSHLLTAKNPESGQTPTTYTYDANGNVITKNDGRGITITYSYDQLNRLTGKSYSDGEPAVAYTYDAHSSTNFGISRRTGMTDGSGSTAWTYDTMGRVSSETRTIGTATHTSSTLYYLNGSPYQITYPSGNVLTYDIHGAGRPQNVTDAAGTTYASGLTYWPAGMLKTGTLGTGISLSDGYNNRLQPSVLQANTSSATLMSLGYDFGLGVNDNGNLNHLINYKDTSRNLTLAYDTANRLKYAHGDQSTPGTHAVGTVIIGGLEAPRCASLPNGCDSGTITITVGPTPIVVSATYSVTDSKSSIVQKLLQNFPTGGLVTAAQTPGNVSQITFTSASTGTAMNLYPLSVTSISDFGGNSTAFSGVANSSTLTGGTDTGLAPGQLNETYVVDAWGNMTSSGTYNAIQPLVPGVDNRFTAYTYDGSGNLLSDGTSGLCGSGTQYAWNAESQITCYGSYAYTYDGDGERVAKSSGTLYWSSGLAESDASGNITSEYIFLAGKRIARRDLPSGAVYYYLSDNLGSSNVVTDASGNIQNESDFYPFGIEDALANNLGNQHFKYTGKERDAESGLDYFPARYYGSGTGRWMSPDWSTKAEPIPYAKLGDPQSLNLYAYVGNNPMSLPDPDGHMANTPYVPSNISSVCQALGSCLNQGEKMGSGAPAQQTATTPAQQQVSATGQQNQTSTAGHPIDKDAIANYADQHAEKGSLGKCAAYCRRAFEAGGVDTSGHPIDAKDWGPTLLKNGAVVVPQDGYSPQKADVAVFAGNDAHPIGHITVYDGKQWVSDFKQRNMSPYRTGTPPVTVYRFPDN